jgi:hypothetical protein
MSATGGDSLRAAAELIVARGGRLSGDVNLIWAARRLGEHYLDSHPADDGVAVDEAWLRAAMREAWKTSRTTRLTSDVICGDDAWEADMAAKGGFIEALVRADRITVRFFPMGEAFDNWVAADNPTRGQFRRLAAALGIRLQERAP